MPMPEPAGTGFFISSRRNAMSFSASGVPAFHSMPAYTSSVFSRKITTFELAGVLHRRRDALEPADRTHAGVEIELLAQGDVDASGRRRRRAW